MQYKYAVVHKGQAHRDDFVAVAIAFAMGLVTKVFRNDPTADELADPNVLVLDVGGEYAPEKGNFDHHQFDRNDPAACACTLLLKHLGLLERFYLLDWVRSTEVMDSKGPFVLAQTLGCQPDAIFRNMSPIEGAMVELFEKRQALNSETDLFGMVMADIGRAMLGYAEEIWGQLEWLQKNAQLMTIGTVPAMVIESDNTKGTQKYRDARHPELGICISHDDRGAGWSLYRFNDHPQVDFSRVKDDPRVLFAHAGGFIAKTKERLPLSEVYALVRRALKCDVCGHLNSCACE